MKLSVRQTYFRVFTIFFVIITPFLVLFTLGYNLNLNKKELSSTLLANIETLPIGANVKINNNQISSTPTEITLQKDKKYSINISKQGFYDEEVNVFSHSQENITTSLKNLSLFPTDSTILAKPETGIKFETLLNENIGLIIKNSEYYLQPFSFGGIQSVPILVENPSKINLKNSQDFDFLNPGYWFKTDNVLLTNINSKWTLVNMDEGGRKANTVLAVNEDQFLVLDTDKNLWTYDPLKKEWISIENNVTGVNYTKSNNFVWMLKGLTVSRFQISSDKKTLPQPQKYIEFSKLYEMAKPADSFQVFSVHQGIAIRINSDIIYIPDYDMKNRLVITNNAKKLFVSGSMIFWIDGDNNLFSYNFLFGNDRFLTKLDAEIVDHVHFFYFPGWKRVQLYGNNKMMSLWLDKEVANSAITYQKPIVVNDVQCQYLVQEKTQFCLKDGNLVSFNNSRFW
jgi:hypothetical protein